MDPQDPGKTITRRLTPAELAEYQPLFDNAKKLRALLTELQDLTLEITGAGSPRSCWLILDTSRRCSICIVLRARIVPAVVPPRPGRRIGYVVSMQPAAWPEPDPLVAAAIAAKYRGKRPRPLAVQIRDQLGQWLDDEEFASVFGIRGRPGWSPSLLALVTVLLATRCRTW